MLLLTKSKGHTSNSHYSEFPNYLQTKPNLHMYYLLFLSARDRSIVSKPDSWPCCTRIFLEQSFEINLEKKKHLFSDAQIAMSQTWRISRLCLLGTFSSFRPRKIQEKNKSWNQEKTKAQKTSYWLHKQDKNNLWSLLKNGVAPSFKGQEILEGKLWCL